MARRKKYLTLSLDEMFCSDYYYTEYDIGGAGHNITIHAKDKKKFLKVFAEEWKKRAEQYLEVDDEFEMEVNNE